MKSKKAPWDREPPFAEEPEPHPPFEEEARHLAEDPPEFAMIRRIEILARLHRTAFRSLFREDGFQPAQAGAMKVIIRHPGLSQRELADQLHIQRATATVMLQKMERAGYIDRRPDKDDQRISRIYPTETAAAMDAENKKNVDAYFARCIEGISQEDFDAMVRGLNQVGANIQSILEENPDPLRKE